MSAALALNFFERNKNCFAIFGGVVSCIIGAKLCLHILKGIRSFFLAPLLKLGVNPKTLGSWAIVTGATDGIGKAYAIALAKKGMNIVLISRTESKLTATAEEIKSIAEVRTKCVSIDFSEGIEIYKSIEDALEGLDIGILVNNVGASYDYPEFFHQLPDGKNMVKKILNINIFSVTYMTSIVLPKMVDKRKGAIVNVGSASCFGFPLLTVYSATKAYVHSFSQNLAAEYSDKGIIIQSLMPGFITTKLSGIKRSSLFVPTPDVYVNCAIESIGNESATYGYWSHSLMMLCLSVIKMMPRSFYLPKYLRAMENQGKMNKERKAAKKQ